MVYECGSKSKSSVSTSGISQVGREKLQHELANQLTQMKKAFPKRAPHMLTIDYLPAQLKVAAAFAAVAGSGPGNAVTCGYYPPPSAEETDEAKRTGIRF